MLTLLRARHCSKSCTHINSLGQPVGASGFELTVPAQTAASHYSDLNRKVLASWVTSLSCPDPQDIDLQHTGVHSVSHSWFSKGISSWRFICWLSQTQRMFNYLMTVRKKAPQKKGLLKTWKGDLVYKQSTGKTCELHTVRGCLFPNFSGILLGGSHKYPPITCLKKDETHLPRIPSNMSLSREAFPELSVPLTWRHGVEMESRTPGFGPWLLPLTSHWPCWVTWLLWALVSPCVRWER